MATLPSLNALRAFEATARLGSVSAAADELHVTHGAVSRQLRTLEHHFGVELFEKSGRGLVPTNHGRTLYPAVGEAFSRLNEGCTALTRHLDEAPFTLACPGSLLARWLIPRLDQLNADLPELRLRVVSSENELDPRREDVDATLRFAAPPWPNDMAVIPLIPERIVAVATPEIWTTAAKDSAHAMLQRLTLLDTASRPQAWPEWAAAMGVDDVTLATARDEGRSFEHLYYLLEAALAGLGVAIAPQLLVAGELRQGRLVAPWPTIETDASLGLWLAPGVDARRGERLAEWLRRELSQGVGARGKPPEDDQRSEPSPSDSAR
ncbi:LysR family transcriptional regulator [Salinicola corii]|uniref:LysR family transcriptional regulator n=1 Tax=Salinicola corii TaxID=2606937 RepID=A0A640WF58_9GAMM|nr:LysR family transcriptional regulator [Salinicola corii]KAA0018793.1 LysR family transcriptional regulator [Salinicola corii]